MRQVEPGHVEEPELSVIERSMRRVFFGASGLSASLVVLWLLVLSMWREIPRPMLVAVSSLLLWSLAVTAYTFQTLWDFSQRIKEQLIHKTFVDELTDVFNFRYLDQRLAEEYERTRRYGGTTSILFLDLDRFKPVNDTYGHSVGNKVLRGIAQTMRSRMRSCDVLGRAGGDEFIAVLPQTDRSQAEILADRLREAVEQYRLEVGAGQVVDFVRVSVGVAVYPTNGNTVESVIGAADAATYEAKREGGNKVCVAKGFVRTEEAGGEMLRIIEAEPGASEPTRSKES